MPCVNNFRDECISVNTTSTAVKYKLKQNTRLYAISKYTYMHVCMYVYMHAYIPAIHLS